MFRSLSVNYAAGGAESEHSHGWAQFLYARTGAIRVEARNRLWVVPPRRGLWLPAGVVHRLRMLGAVELRTLYLRPEDVPQTLVPATATRVIDVCGLLHEAILRICALRWLDERRVDDVHLAALVVAEIVVADSTSLHLVMPLDPRARRLADAMLAPQLETHPELVDLYRTAGLSRRTGERLFKQETGLAPARWRRLAGLSRSLEHLVKGGRMESAVILAGYSSRAAFSAAFTKTFGFSPKSVRR